MMSWEKSKKRTFLQVKFFKNICTYTQHLEKIHTNKGKTTTTHLLYKKDAGEATRGGREGPDLVLGYKTAGERHRAALPTGVVGGAVEIHVLGPVCVGHATTAAELRRYKRICGVKSDVLEIYCINIVLVLRLAWWWNETFRWKNRYIGDI